MHIESYARDRLIPQLKSYGLADQQIAIVVDDVCRRLRSLLSRWADEAFRQTVLVAGLEEARFYKPRKFDMDVRALVVLGVRNSLIEDLGASRAYTKSLHLNRRVLTDKDMPFITGEAIRFFGGLDKDALQAASPPADGDDVFGDLPVKYPLTWRVLSHVADRSTYEAEFEPITATQPDIPVGTQQPPRENERFATVLSGIDPAIDPPLQQTLGLIKEGVIDVFFADSFKGITRNIDKLYKVIEYVLCHGGIVLTHNYYLSNGYTARRHPLLPPYHSSDEVIAKLKRRGGLTRRHKEALRAVERQLRGDV